MQTESYVFDPRPQYPLVVTAKRYWHPEHCDDSADAFTIICTHCTGAHKEQWEPTFQDFYDALKDGTHPPKVREIWCLDCPNHGDAAVINESELAWGYSEVCKCWHIICWVVVIAFGMTRFQLVGRNMHEAFMPS